MHDPEPNDDATRHRSEGSSVEDLVRRAQTGSSTAFGELVRRFESPLFDFLLRRVRNAADAEDLAQETFVRAWRNLDRYDPRWSFPTWLFTIARRSAATRLRSVGPALEGSESLGTLASRVEAGGNSAENAEREGLWSIAERVLAPDPCSALWLRYAEGLTIPEIARVLDRSSVSVRVMLFRARATLGRFLDPSPRGSKAGADGAGTVRWREAEV